MVDDRTGFPGTRQHMGGGTSSQALGRQVADGLDRVYRESMLAPPAPRPVALVATAERSGADGAPRRLGDLPAARTGGV